MVVVVVVVAHARGPAAWTAEPGRCYRMTAAPSATRSGDPLDLAASWHQLYRWACVCGGSYRRLKNAAAGSTPSSAAHRPAEAVAQPAAADAAAA